MPDLQLTEPPIDPLDDTHPTQTVPMVDPHGTRAARLPAWRLTAGLISLIGAAGFTLAAALVLMSAQSSTPSTPVPTPGGGNIAPIIGSQTASATPLPTTEAQISSLAPAPAGAPTLSADAASTILQQPVSAVGGGESASAQIVINRRDPFTLIPDRPRSEVIQYTVVQGDTINTIAERYGIKPETIAWSNPRGIVIGLLPGMVLNVLPVDGVYHQANGFETISDLAVKYKVEALVITDSPFNRALGTLTPETLLDAGRWVVVPGGEGESINWNPQVTISGGDGSGGSTGDNVVQQPQTVTFAPGEAGSCPPQEIAGGTAWVNPLPNGTWMRGFDGIHTGVDVASPEGTPVRAANGGRVIFAGWNSFGYGYTIVLIHGPFIMTLYGHLSDIYVGCGQYVDAGTVIGAVGTTGNSTGPHLHFEILSRQASGGWVPTNPSSTLGF